MDELCKEIKRYDFNLRLSVNLTDQFDKYADLRSRSLMTVKSLAQFQVTLRILYSIGAIQTKQTGRKTTLYVQMGRMRSYNTLSIMDAR